MQMVLLVCDWSGKKNPFDIVGVKLTALFGTGLYSFVEIEKYSLWSAGNCFSALLEASKFLLTDEISFILND